MHLSAAALDMCTNFTRYIYCSFCR